MSEFNDAGYVDLRTYLTSASGWSHVALVDADGTIETVIDIHNDSRASWGDPANNGVTLTLDLAGGDSDLSTPVELAQSALYTGSGEASARVRRRPATRSATRRRLTTTRSRTRTATRRTRSSAATTT